jgi:hypothetical protein
VNETAIQSLIDEVTEYLDAGRVGLYEFLWILRSDHPEVSEQDACAHARAALDRMKSAGLVRLVWERWGDASDERPADDVVVEDRHFEDPTEQPYLAVIAADEQ